MNAEATIDWASWEVEEPALDFVDRVMDAALAESRRSAPVRRPRRSGRSMGMLAAAAVAAGSFTVLAIMARNTRRVQSLWIEAQQGASDRAVASVTVPGGVAASPTVSNAPPQAEHAAGTVVDRKLRDAVRARLVTPLQEQGVERDPHTGLTVPAGSNGPSHNLSREYLQQRIREDFYPLAQACYAEALAKQPELRGQIVVDFMIVGDAKVGGIVDQAKINDRTDVTDAEFVGCIRESMLSMVFAPPDNDGWVTVTYPFKFSPGDDDDARDR
jgi:hypothetical protein